MKKVVIMLCLLLPFVVNAQQLNQKGTDPKKHNEILLGYCNREGFVMINSNFDSAYRAEYVIYKPDEMVLSQLRPALKGVTIKVVMGTWCGDSKEWVPRFYKVMDHAGFNYKKMKLIAVDRDKKAGALDITDLKIERVPTFIFYKKKKELGRIIEVPNDLIEKDMLKIISGK
jgi:thiol-disulfide isomerase/thioredoxin